MKKGIKIVYSGKKQINQKSLYTFSLSASPLAKGHGEINSHEHKQ